MKTYTIIGGVNGVGKSSLLGVFVAVDSCLGLIIDTERAAGVENAERLTDDCLSKGISFTLETTLSGVKTLKTIKRARDLRYLVRLYYVGVGSLDESISRIQNRVRKGGHDIPEEDVKRRYNKRFEDLAKVLPYCNEVYFYDNENGFCEVAQYRNGSLIFTTKNIPEWLKEFSDFLNNR